MLLFLYQQFSLIFLLLLFLLLYFFIFFVIFFIMLTTLATWTNIKKFIHYKRIFSSFLPLHRSIKGMHTEGTYIREIFFAGTQGKRSESTTNVTTTKMFHVLLLVVEEKKTGMTYYQKWPFIICFILINYS